MQRNLILAFALTLLVILIAQPLLEKYGPKPPAKPAATAPQPAATPAPASPSGVTATPSAPAGPVPAQQAAAEQEIVVENGLYKITFTNRGAQVKSWLLKKYNDDKGKPLELVNQTAAPQYGYPLSLWTYDADLKNKLNSALYVAQAGAPCPAKSLCDQIMRTPKAVESSPLQLSFLYSEGDLLVRKSFTFDHSYVVQVETSVTRAGQRVQAYPAWPPGFGYQNTASAYAAARIDYQAAYKVQRLAPKKISGGATVHGPLEWAGAVDQYFSAVFLPDDPQNATLITLHESIKIPKDLQKPDPKDTADVPVLGVAVGDATDVTRERLFVGPKDIDVLGAVPVGAGDTLRDLVDFGYLSFIAKPLFLWLKWTHQHWVSNWGWSIVILTLIINVALLPLKLSSMKSMLKMQKIQPQVKAIQAKYAKYKLTDPRRQQGNQEVQELMKKEGANPMGGCLPMVLSLFFLWPFYTVLGVAIELRQAHWLWVTDLSSADPLHLLPISIVVTMFIMQKVTPAAGMDPMQQKMMTVMMPVMMGFIAWSFPSGLCLYWAASQLIGWGQQTWLNNTKYGREMREHLNKRAAKKT